MKRRALGKGLSGLIPTSLPASVASSVPALAAAPASRPAAELRLEVSKIRPNPKQPRRSFDEAGLEELARSFKTQGMLQPVVVRAGKDGAYELIAGERRWRAAQKAGIHQIPAVIRDISDVGLLEAALVENLQREDLNAMEEAEAYRLLVDDLSLTQGEVAERVGKPRTTVANALRLLGLPKRVQELVRNRQISMGHARALLALEDAHAIEELADRIVKEGLSVRDVELRARRVPSAAPRAGRPPKAVDPNVVAAEQALQRAVGTRVRILGNGTVGRIELVYHSAEELDRLYSLLMGTSKQGN